MTILFHLMLDLESYNFYLKRVSYGEKF